MAGLATAQQSSAAFASMGSQAELALNSGWIFDQNVNAAGAFVTNTSPTSSGLTFVSTGDATGFYVIGRTLRVIQAAGTAICTVGQSSFGGGITTVYLNQFSTQAGLSTTLTTGAITSAAASPIYPQSTANNTFGGATLFATTGGNPGIGVGPTPASTGTFRAPYLGTLAFRNSGNTLDTTYGYDSVGWSWINEGQTVRIMSLANNGNLLVTGTVVSQSTVSAPAVAIGTTPGSSGLLRIANSAIAIVGKTSTGGDDIIWPQQFSSTTLSADVLSTSATYTNVISKSLAVGTWHIVAGVTFMSTLGGNITMNARIDDGTNVYAAGTVISAVGPSTTFGFPVTLSAIVINTTTLTYNLAINAGLSGAGTAKAMAINPASTVSPSSGATFWTAVKIG